MTDSVLSSSTCEEVKLRTEIVRLNKVIKALIDRAERSTHTGRSDFGLFQTTIMLEEQVRHRTQELSTALRENERMGHALRKSEATFRGIVSQSLVGIAIIENGRFTYANTKVAEIFGYTPEEMLRLCVLDIVAARDQDLVKDQMRRRLEGEVDHIEYVFRGRRKNRAEIDLECHSSVMDLGGQPAVIDLIIDVTERIRSSERLLELQEQLREQAIHDPLTHLYNRLPLSEFLDRELSLARRKGYPVTVVLADLDHFKKVNDTYGHPAGDEVLKIFADLIRKRFRSNDMCCRYGGEEFLIVLPDMTTDEGIQRADELRAAIEQEKISSNASIIKVTASFWRRNFSPTG